MVATQFAQVIPVTGKVICLFSATNASQLITK
jgi:hypothetical protein